MDTQKLVDTTLSCCGCGACENVCPADAITLKTNEFGFKFPQINEDRCIGCNLCLKVCAYKQPTAINTVKETFVAVANDKETLKTTASGGVFTTLATSFIKNGGSVYGCALVLNEDGVLEPKHIKVTTKEDLPLLSGSKYVQSDIGLIFRDIKKELLLNNKVLFSGTPCQVEGLKSFLGKDFPNLLTIDLICHGVPSSKMFKDYLSLKEKKLKGKIISYKFRDKTEGWGLSGKIEVKKKNGKIKVYRFPSRLSSYYQFFLESSIYRDSCYSCKYAGENRVGDLTVGDYWGIEKMHPEYLTANGGTLDENKGVSCLILNTDKGLDFVQEYGEGLTLLPSTFEKARTDNGQLNKPSKQPVKERKTILSLYKEKGYAGVEKYYDKKLGVKRYVYKVKNLFSASFKIKVKKILTFGKSK